jgi:hypothetical protein
MLESISSAPKACKSLVSSRTRLREATGAPHLAVEGCAFTPVWWVTFCEQTRVISRECRSKQADLFHERIGNHVTDDVMRVFDPAHVLFRNVNIEFRERAQLASIPAR